MGIGYPVRFLPHLLARARRRCYALAPGTLEIRTQRHTLIRADAAPSRLMTRSSEDQLLDYDGSARILPCSAWEGSWEEPPSQPSK